MLKGKAQTEREIQHQAVRSVEYDDTSKCCRGQVGCWNPYGCAKNFICKCHARLSKGQG